MAKYYELGEHDVVGTVLTDSAVMYGSRIAEPVSYTHLDVYKRQLLYQFGAFGSFRFHFLFNGYGKVLFICILQYTLSLIHIYESSVPYQNVSPYLSSP